MVIDAELMQIVLLHVNHHHHHGLNRHHDHLRVMMRLIKVMMHQTDEMNWMVGFTNSEYVRRLILTFTFGGEVGEETISETSPDIRTDQNVARSTPILNDGSDVNGSGKNGRVGWSLRFATTEWSVLTHKIQIKFATRVGPEPSF